MSTHHDIVIVGAGFAGVRAAVAAAAHLHAHPLGRPARITLVAPGEHLVIAPRLYETDLSGVRVPLAGVLGPVGVAHLATVVERIDPDRRRLRLAADGGPSEIGYDQLVLAAGSRMATPAGAEHGHRIDGWAGATALRAAVPALHPHDHVVVVGGGFAGIELAAELAGRARVTLLERGPAPGGGYGPRARERIGAALRSLGVVVRTGAAVAAIAPDRTLTLAGGERITADEVALATGPRAHPLAAQVPGEHDELGRLVTDGHLRTTAEGVWAAGDVAAAQVDEHGHVAPMSCQHAGPQGGIAGVNAAAALRGENPRAYTQPLYITCLDLGAAGALVTRGFARDEVIATGDRAKALKRYINRSLIYPPPDGDADALRRWALTPAAGPSAGTMLRLALRSRRLAGAALGRAPDRAAATAGM